MGIFWNLSGKKERSGWEGKIYASTAKIGTKAYGESEKWKRSFAVVQRNLNYLRWRRRVDHRINEDSQRLLLLRCLLWGGCFNLGEGPEEEDPQGPKLVNKRLSSGCDRFVGVICQHQPKQKQIIISCHVVRQNKKACGLRTGDCPCV
jgi:hypothetical protein